MLDLFKADIMGSKEEYAWSDTVNTAFWIDPVEEIVIF